MKYVNFVDMHDDDCGGIVEVTDAEFAKLLPHRHDMANCNPLPASLHRLLWDRIYVREKVEVDPELLAEEYYLTQTIC
jgi:hypothetical protein